MRAARNAQVEALNFESGTMDSGVPPAVATQLIRLKIALANAADTELACHPVSESPLTLQKALDSFFKAAAPGLHISSNTSEDNDNPEKGIFGNDVKIHVGLFVGPPRLLELEIESSTSCGTDSQLLIYEEKANRWSRALRASSDFKQHNNVGSSWGDFFLTKILVPDAKKPYGWYAIVAHGTPWCTSRFSSFGLAVLSPSPNGEGRVVWQTERSYSRSDFAPRMNISGDTFELRVRADDMIFDSGNGFERTTIYRYRVSDPGVTRLEPIATNGRGFVEEWLEMPWKEAASQSASDHIALLQRVHAHYEKSYPENSNTYTSWSVGPVRACSDADRAQVEFDTTRNVIVPSKPGGDTFPETKYYFQLLRVPNGYRMMDITEQPDHTCTGPDLMHKPKP